MSIFELLAWLYVIGVFVCSLVVLLGMAWARYCSWVIQREREWFWSRLSAEMEQKARMLAAIKQQGFYR